MASPFPPHVRDFLFPCGFNLVDKKGVCIQPLTSSRSLKTALREVEGQRRRSLIPAILVERPSDPLVLPMLPSTPGLVESQEISKELLCSRTRLEELGESELVAIVPSQRLLAFLHTRSEAPLRKPVGRVRLPPFPFSIPRKGMHRSAVSSRVASPVLPKVGNRSGERLNEDQSPVTYRAEK